MIICKRERERERERSEKKARDDECLYEFRRLALLQSGEPGCRFCTPQKVVMRNGVDLTRSAISADV